MLKGIPEIISPELLKILDEMGHGDEIVLADGNFPGKSLAKNFVRADGHGTVELLEAILKLFPLDTYDKSVYIMEKVIGDTVDVPIWDEFTNIIKPYTKASLTKLERYDFYARAAKAYAIVQTSEKAQYANIILKKGVITNVTETEL